MTEESRSQHAPGSVRHVEKRRVGTCRFADRIAQVSLDTFRARVPTAFRDNQKQTCVATVVAHFGSDGHLQVMGLGLGTKFLTEAVLREEESQGMSDGGSKGYGCRVRDCHAEVLARRAFRRQLCLEMKYRLQGWSVSSSCIEDLYRPVLRRAGDAGACFELVDEVTLHFYSSSAPCGNATLKKFTKMGKEKFNDALGPDDWPEGSHDPIQGHSIGLGQFSLLVKKDPKSEFTEQADAFRQDSHVVDRSSPNKGKVWPANQSDDWCPPGTSIVAFRKGSLHTCSDKLCRWNCLGLQGSLLASLLMKPLYMSTITVGRKFTAAVCRRAVCCRAECLRIERGPPGEVTSVDHQYSLHHPAVMGTGVYMDDSGVIDMTGAKDRSQDVRFDSTLAWVWWPFLDGERSEVLDTANCSANMAECIDASTGFVHDYFQDDVNGDETDACGRASLVSTAEMVRLFLEVSHGSDWMDSPTTDTLKGLREFKRKCSPEYEMVKDELLSKHRVFGRWRRRQDGI